jgi:hypothetical protein
MLSRNDLQGLLTQKGVWLHHHAVSSVAELESWTEGLFKRMHQPATRVNARYASVDGYSSRVSPEGFLLGHAEGYYRPCIEPPDVCVFWCQQAPRVAGGETTWVDGGALLDALPVNLRERLLCEAVVYEMTWDRSRWQNEFLVTDERGLKAVLEADERCEYTLNDDGLLHLSFRTPAVRVGADGVKRFVNGVLAHLPQVTHPRYAGHVRCTSTNRVLWASGGVLTPADIHALIDAHDQALKRHRWQDGDLLVLDNHRVLHGRERMVSPDQRVIYSRFGFWA